MALSGSLADMDINDVLQLPTLGLRTGEMRIDHGSRSARVFYTDGQIVHVILDDKLDEDACVDLLGWTTGDFVFEQGIVAPRVTIEEDPHRLLIRCAKKHDERKRRPPAKGGGVVLNSPEVSEALDEALKTHAGFNVMAFVAPDGKILGAVPPNAPTDLTTQYALKCFDLAKAPPRAEIRRCWIEDDDGHCLWLRLGGEVSFVILSKPSVPLGSVMLAASKVGASLKGLLGGSA